LNIHLQTNECVTNEYLKIWYIRFSPKKNSSHKTPSIDLPILVLKDLAGLK